MKHYPHLFLAGTFDGLHAGHRVILTRAFEVGERVTIGLTSDEFVKKFKVQRAKCKVRTYEERKKVLEQWLKKNNKYALIIPIDDPYEPAASMKDLDALIVTRENRKTGERINELRQGLALSPLTLIEVPMVAAEDGKPVSSTRMRNGEIDHYGKLIMPESMRGVLGRPLGKVIKNWIPDRVGDDITTITVGDIATKTLLDAGITPKLAIIDGKVGRKPFHETVDRLQPQRVSPFEAKTVKSGPGFIGREAVEAIEHCFSSYVLPLTSYVILVDGEEDLLVLPAILHAPLGSILYYGQPGEGLVEVKITKPLKEKARLLLGQFFS
ncbi:MAG: pantetheine-phosphate adenylyltransferase [Patescibacteria group bacterium]